jgi:hypothetical protein
MISLSIYVLMVIVGLTLVRRTSHRGRRLWAEERFHLNRANLILNQRTTELLDEKHILVQKLFTLEQNRELDRSVTEDAVKREHRAKEALLAVLKQNHCTPEQIERVMNAVDGEKIKD